MNSTTESLLGAVAGLQPRSCRLPECPRAVLSVFQRGPGDAEPPGGTPVPRRGGQRPQFCSEEHQRLTGERVKRLCAMLAQVEAALADAPARQRKSLRAAAADLRHRLLLHGEPDRANTTSATRQVPVVDGTHRMTAVAGRAALVAVDAGPLGDSAGTPEPHLAPVLALRRLADPGLWAEGWSRLQDAADGTRALEKAVRRAVDARARQSLVGKAWLECVELVQAVDGVLSDLVAIRPDGSSGPLT